MKTLDCNIVKDLLPSYIEKLTSNESNIAIEEHIKECTSCSEEIKAMESSMAATPAPTDEIDYLKKIKRKITVSKMVGFGTLSLVLIVGLVFFVRFCIVGSPVDLRELTTSYDSITDTVTISGSVNGYVSRVSVEESKKFVNTLNLKVYTVDFPIFFKSQEFTKTLPVTDALTINCIGEENSVITAFHELDTRSSITVFQNNTFSGPLFFDRRDILPKVQKLLWEAKDTEIPHTHDVPNTSVYYDIFMQENPRKVLYEYNEDYQKLLETPYRTIIFVFEREGKWMVSIYGQPLKELSHEAWVELEGYMKNNTYTLDEYQNSAYQ